MVGVELPQSPGRRNDQQKGNDKSSKILNLFYRVFNKKSMLTNCTYWKKRKKWQMPSGTNKEIFSSTVNTHTTSSHEKRIRFLLRPKRWKRFVEVWLRKNQGQKYTPRSRTPYPGILVTERRITQYSTVQYSTVQYSTVLFRIIDVLLGLYDRCWILFISINSTLQYCSSIVAAFLFALTGKEILLVSIDC
jgi:hypothetical protein